MSRILIATDLHQRAVLYQALVKLCDEVNPDALILGGDFLHGTGLLPYGKTRQLTPMQCAVTLNAISVPILFVLSSGVDPQQPPTMLSQPFLKNTSLHSAMSCGDSSYPPMALGNPALEYTCMKHSTHFDSLSTNGTMWLAPKAQFKPTHMGLECLIEA